MIKIKFDAKNIDLDKCEVKYNIKNSNAIEHVALIEFLIEQIEKNASIPREEIIDNLKELTTIIREEGENK